MLATPVRIVLSVVLLAGCALSLTLAAVFVAKVNFSGLAHPARAIGVTLLLCVLGSMMGYAGFRLMKGAMRARASSQL